MGTEGKNDLADAAAKEAENLRAELLAERAARIQAERTVMATSRQPARAEPQAAPEDPFEKFAADSLEPEKTRELLDRGTNMRVARGLAMMERQLDQKLRASQMDNEQRVAYDMLLATNPDIAENPREFAEAAGAVDFDLKSRNVAGLRPGEYYGAVLSEYRKKKPQPIPYIEGAGAPDSGGGGRQAQKEKIDPEQKWMAEKYGFDPKEVTPFEMGSKETREQTENYVDQYNERNVKKGMGGRMPETYLGIEKRLKPRRAAAGQQ